MSYDSSNNEEDESISLHDRNINNDYNVVGSDTESESKEEIFLSK